MNKPKKRSENTGNKYLNEDNKIYNQACDYWEEYHKQALIEARIEELEWNLKEQPDMKQYLERIAQLTKEKK